MAACLTAIVGIVDANYGNRLQNYALQSALSGILGARGRVETLRRGYPDEQSQLLARMAKRALRPIWHAVRPTATAKMKTFSRKYIDFSPYALTLTHPERFGELVSHYDVFVIGSDQVWNPDFKINSELNYLPFVPSEKKIAYVASFGVARITQNRERTAELLDAIPRISVREDAGADIVRELTGRDVPVMLDPTMLLSTADWDAVARRPRIAGIDAPYLLKYVLGDDVHGADVEAMARRRGLAVVELGDSAQPVGPAEFVWLVAHASLVCTDSFHGSVFSLLYHRPFAIFERQDACADMSSRLDTLCRLFGCGFRRFGSDGWDEARVMADDWDAVDAALEAQRARSLAWLREALAAAEGPTPGEHEDANAPQDGIA